MKQNKIDPIVLTVVLRQKSYTDQQKNLIHRLNEGRWVLSLAWDRLENRVGKMPWWGWFIATFVVLSVPIIALTLHEAAPWAIAWETILGVFFVIFTVTSMILETATVIEAKREFRQIIADGDEFVQQLDLCDTPSYDGMLEKARANLLAYAIKVLLAQDFLAKHRRKINEDKAATIGAMRATTALADQKKKQQQIEEEMEKLLLPSEREVSKREEAFNNLYNWSEFHLGTRLHSGEGKKHFYDKARAHIRVVAPTLAEAPMS